VGAEKNLLDYVVSKAESARWQRTEAGLVRIIIARDGWAERAARIFKNTPRSFTADLDQFGSFVWEAIDGGKTVEAIGALLRARFGAEVEPVYERLGLFLCILQNNKLIRLAENKAGVIY
jgi:hypothetical protein